ncbi:MAG TPA: ABC transporter permease [Thermomicrobiales bacterium]|nr:ABC transporter permease [Thermomicrobiales bacterium]
MNLLAFLRRRVVQMIPVLLGISLITFFMIHLIPGDPARNMLGPRATPERVAELRQSLGLDEPLWSQYRRFLAGVVRGDLGTSLYYRQSVGPLVLERLPPTIFLIVYSAVIALIVAIPLGIVAAVRRNTWIDQAIRTISLITLAMPAFWLGVLFILYFGLNRGWFPVGGYGETFREHVHHLFLPSLTIALAMAPILIRSLRSSMVGNLRAQYATTARAKGLTDSRVVTGHVLRPSLISTVTVLGVNLGFLIGSTVIIETVFAIPGLGFLMVSSIQARDYPVIQAVTLVMAVLVIVVNLLTDVTYALLDPRVSYD